MKIRRGDREGKPGGAEGQKDALCLSFDPVSPGPNSKTLPPSPALRRDLRLLYLQRFFPEREALQI